MFLNDKLLELNFDTAKLRYSQSPHHTVVGVYLYPVYGMLFLPY